MLKLERLRNLAFINTMFKSSPLISEVTLAGVARFQPHFSLIPIAILSAVGTVLCYPDESDPGKNVSWDLARPYPNITGQTGTISLDLAGH